MTCQRKPSYPRGRPSGLMMEQQNLMETSNNVTERMKWSDWITAISSNSFSQIVSRTSRWIIHAENKIPFDNREVAESPNGTCRLQNKQKWIIHVESNVAAASVARFPAFCIHLSVHLLLFWRGCGQMWCVRRRGAGGAGGVYHPTPVTSWSLGGWQESDVDGWERVLLRGWELLQD